MFERIGTPTDPDAYWVDAATRWVTIGGVYGAILLGMLSASTAPAQEAADWGTDCEFREVALWPPSPPPPPRAPPMGGNLTVEPRVRSTPGVGGFRLESQVEPTYPAAWVSVDPGLQRCRAWVTLAAGGAPLDVGVDGCADPFIDATREAIWQWRWSVPNERVDRALGTTVVVHFELVTAGRAGP